MPRKSNYILKFSHRLTESGYLHYARFYDRTAKNIILKYHTKTQIDISKFVCVFNLEFFLELKKMTDYFSRQYHPNFIFRYSGCKSKGYFLKIIDENYLQKNNINLKFD